MFKKLTLALALLCAHNASYALDKEDALRYELDRDIVTCGGSFLLGAAACLAGKAPIGIFCCCVAGACAYNANQTGNELLPLADARRKEEKRKAQEDRDERERKERERVIAKRLLERDYRNSLRNFQPRAPQPGYMYQQ